MGRYSREHGGGRVTYSCKNCRTFLSNKEAIVSKTFQGASGKAYLFEKAWNVVHGELVQREMMTGSHLVRDVMCKFCDSKVGWMYEIAFNDDQRYKEGRVILEKALMIEQAGCDEPVQTAIEEGIVLYEPAQELFSDQCKRRKYMAELTGAMKCPRRESDDSSASSSKQ